MVDEEGRYTCMVDLCSNLQCSAHRTAFIYVEDSNIGREWNYQYHEGVSSNNRFFSA